MGSRGNLPREASCSRFAPVAPGKLLQVAGQEAPGSCGKTPWVIEQGGNHEDGPIENLVFQSELNYILYLLAVTKSTILGISDSGVLESSRCDCCSGSE